MRHSNSRIVKVKKADLISKIKENKKAHIEEYEKACISYKEEALKQLTNLINAVNDGGTKIKLDLISPVNNAENYDKIIQTFEWEVEDIVELTQDEFNEYVLDETDLSQMAKFSNSAYFH